MAFRFWVDDFDGGTSYMTNEELGAYLRLLIYQFRNECIPQHIFDRITRGLTTVEQVREKFTLNNGCLQQHRMVEIRKDSIEQSEKQSIKGKKSAELRLNRGSTTVQPHGSGRGSGNNGSILEKGGVGEKTFYDQSINDEGWQEVVMRTCDIKDPVAWITKFNDHSIATEEHYNRLADWRRHCVNWIKREIEKLNKQQTNGKQPKSARSEMDKLRDWYESVNAPTTGSGGE